MSKNTRFQILNYLDERWKSFINTIPSATIFHHPVWMQVLHQCYGYRFFVFALFNDAGQIVAGIPIAEIENALGKKRLISLPFSDHCQPLCHSSEELNQLIKHIGYLYNRSEMTQIEIRWELISDAFISFSNYVLHTIKLDSDINKVITRFTKMHGRNINIGKKRGVLIEWGKEEKHLRTFYDLHLQARHRQGIPIQPWRFFKLLKDIVFNQGLGFVLLARHKSKYLAGAVFLTWRKKLIYKYGASCTEGLKLRPNNIIFYNAIRWGCENGYTLCDLGKTEISNIGLRNFKNGWGAEERPLIYSTLNANCKNKGINYFIPLGKMVIRNSPKLVCHVIGELFYKYFT